ncbi:uncharacterized protein LOC103309790 [Acyrthosiphon pisum]|uniref:Protein ANTAGONIST OF LIKE HETEROCHROMATIN PROTEIN 1-like n=1 Tax=Acyrthosiphon pisum TaxID=7029 RepID=A0A8R2JQ57_ACYPI|nr:uncharacterized protein LOC103309790 [Acyrthosiphon pisum]
MPKFNKKQLAMIALILDDEEKNCNRTKKNWVRKMFTERKFVGEFHTLFKELEDEEIYFYKYLRMSQSQFYVLLTKIQPKIQKQNTTFREAISPKEKLMVCLRFLATGDSFQTISFSYRLGHSTVHYIVKEVCKAIVDELLAEVMPQPKEKDWEKISDDFWKMWNFHNCLGALDGKHVDIFCSSEQWFPIF